jgi:palmitoyltransferase ZDHHC2/15/20
MGRVKIELTERVIEPTLDNEIDRQDNEHEIDNEFTTTTQRLLFTIPFLITLFILSTSFLLYCIHMVHLERYVQIFIAVPSFVMVWVSLYYIHHNWSGIVTPTTVFSNPLKYTKIGDEENASPYCTPILYPELVNPISTFERTRTKRIRYCFTCHIYKPDRCHHCSICNSCILRFIKFT